MATPEKDLLAYMNTNWVGATIVEPIMYSQVREPDNMLPNILYGSSEKVSPFEVASLGAVYYHKRFLINIQIVAANATDLSNYEKELERLFEAYNQSISGGQMYIASQTHEEEGKKILIEYNLDYEKYE